MPYKDPEMQRQAVRESKRRAAERKALENAGRAIAEHGDGIQRVTAPPPGKDELLSLLGVQARHGSVRAIELLLRMEAEREALKRPGQSIIDELANRRDYVAETG